MTTNAQKKNRQNMNRNHISKLIRKQRRIVPLATGVHEITANEINKRPYKAFKYITPTPVHFL